MSPTDPSGTVPSGTGAVDPAIQLVAVPFSSRLALLGFMATAVIGLAVSGLDPYDRATWWLEVLPVVVALPLLGWTHERFPLTWLAYVLIALHTVILVTGGHYTYARVPLGSWMEHFFHLARNDYDRIGHFAQGFVPAIIVREILLRRTPLRRGGWLSFLVVCVCMAISVCYEFVEWWTALIAGSRADDFLGTQGDPWDTQWDMLSATLGAITALLLLSRTHDRALAALPGDIVVSAGQSGIAR
jgi:putative membrane protein